MKAVVWHGAGDIRLDDVPGPKIEQPTGAVIRLTASAICGTDLHFVRGTFTGMKAGTILDHEGVGTIEQLGPMVRNFDVGDRVVVCSTIACGTCSYCRAGYYAQCDNANPNGPSAGTSFFGGPADTGPVNGLQAERARIPHAATTLFKVPEEKPGEAAGARVPDARPAREGCGLRRDGRHPVRGQGDHGRLRRPEGARRCDAVGGPGGGAL